jgi:hypothetical protein
METNNQQQTPSAPETVSMEAVLLEILENSRKTKKYMQWSMYITIALVVIPLIGALIMIPILLSSISKVYSGSGLLQ